MRECYLPSITPGTDGLAVPLTRGGELLHEEAMQEMAAERREATSYAQRGLSVERKVHCVGERSGHQLVLVHTRFI